MSKLKSLAVGLLLASALDAQTWIKSSVNNHYYRLNTTKMTWKAAEAEAVRQGGHLVTIRNKAEQDWIVRNFPSVERKWIGLTDEAKEGHWAWSSGESVTYTNWCKNFPSTKSALFDYAELPGHGCWENDHPGGSFQSIIEKKGFPSHFSVFGRGCASTVTLPTISSSTLPALGKTFTLEIKGFLPKPQSGQLIFGASNTSWGTNTLPMKLAVLGIHGCLLFASLDVFTPFSTNSTGSFTANLAVPSSPALAGLTFYAQAWAPDAKANPLGLGMTNAAKFVLGY